jgi:hypothetical protein
VIQISSTPSSTLPGPLEDLEAANPEAPRLPDAAATEPLAWGDPMARLRALQLLHPGMQSLAYQAGGSGSGGGGGSATTTTVSQAELLKEMKGGWVDTKNLGAPLKKALADAGLAPADLARLAGKDGRVTPDKLFAFIDKLDSNGKPGSFDATTTDASGATVPTKAGALYEALKTEVSANRELAANGMDAKAFASLAARHGVLDLNHLGGAVTKALAGSGVTRADLEAIAGPDGQIKGGKEFAALHALLDKADGRADGIASSRTVRADGTVAQSASAALLLAIQADVAVNRKLSQYAQPGTAPAPTQARLTVAANALKVDPKDQKPVDLKMKGVDQFSLYPGDSDKGGKACYEAAVKACTSHNAKTHGKDAPQLAGPDDAIQIGYAEDGNGRLAIDEAQAARGRAYIDKALDAGLPAVAGVSYADEGYNNDLLTDHFITIDKRDYDDQGRLYYEFKDPGAGGAAYRLYVDADSGKLFKEGDQKGAYVKNADYEVTQVRTYGTAI